MGLGSVEATAFLMPHTGIPFSSVVLLVLSKDMSNRNFKNLLALYRFIPTALTLGNVLCGFTAIINVLRIYEVGASEIPGVLVKSAWLIAGAMLFDLLDGWTARKLNATSEMGVQMDSLADMVTFGIAPATMVVVVANRMSEIPDALILPKWLIWSLCAVYVSCVALRLALYNVIAMSGKSSDTFNGLPSPGGAAAVASLIFVYKFFATNQAPRGIIAKLTELGIIDKFISNATVENYILNILPIYAALLGFLMVSRIQYKHFGKWLGSRKHYRLKMFIVIVFFIFMIRHPLIVATVAINTYVIWGAVKSAFLTLRQKFASHKEQTRTQAHHGGN